MEYLILNAIRDGRAVDPTELEKRTGKRFGEMRSHLENLNDADCIEIIGADESSERFNVIIQETGRALLKKLDASGAI